MLGSAHQACAFLMLCPFFAHFILYLPFLPHVTRKRFLLDSAIVILCRSKQRNMEREKKRERRIILILQKFTGEDKGFCLPMHVLLSLTLLVFVNTR